MKDQTREKKRRMKKNNLRIKKYERRTTQKE